MKNSFCAAASLSLSLAGCTATDLLSRNLPSSAADHIHIYSRNEDLSRNVIDKALADCPDETESAETICVRDAIERSRLDAGSLAALIPACRPGITCEYVHTTQRRLGLIPAYATIVRKNWRVAIDLSRGAASAFPPPITVSDADVFVVPPAKPAVTAQASLAAEPAGAGKGPAGP